MALLDDYREVIQELKSLESHIVEINSQKELANAEIENIEQSRTSIDTDISTKKQQAVTDAINVKMREEVSPIRMELLTLNRELGALPELRESELDNVRTQYYLDGLEPIIHELKKAKKIIKSYEKIFNSISDERVEATVDLFVKNHSHLTLGELKRLENVVSIDAKEAESIADASTLHNVSDTLLLSGKVFDKLDPKLKILAYTGYILAMSAGVMLLPGPFCAIYLPLLGVSAVNAVRHERVSLKLVTAYRQLVSVYSGLKEKLQEISTKRRAAAVNKVNVRYTNKTEALRREFDDKSFAAHTAESKVHQTLDTTEVFKELENSIISESAGLDTREKELVSDLDMLEEQLVSCNKSIGELQERQLQLKRDIVDYYVTNESPGESRLIPKSFFLGFNEKLVATEFDYGGDSTLVLYDGESTQVITKLIRMMLVQLLSELSVLCMHVDIVECHSGCADYAIFRPKGLESVFDFISVHSQFSDLIQKLHDDLERRNALILPMADNIEIYNQNMIDRNSVTQGYEILFIQDFDIDAVLSDPVFMQLCVSGPQVGIVPIIFLAESKLEEWVDGSDASQIDNLIKLLQSVGQKVFKYNGILGSFYAKDPSYKYKVIDIFKNRINEL